MSSGRHVRLPALRIPSEPPKFKFRKKVIAKTTGDKRPHPSTTSCDKIVNKEPKAKAPEVDVNVDEVIRQQERHLPPIHKEPMDSKIPGLYGAYYSQCVCEKNSNIDPLNAAPPNHQGVVGKVSATELLAGKVEQPVKYKHFAYGSNDWLHLLVTGQLPPEVLQAFMNKFCRAGTTLKAHGPNADKYFYYQGGRKRTKELWEPKQMRQQQVYSQFHKEQLEASCRQRKNMKELSKKAELMAKRNESVLLKKMDKVDSRIKSYLDKMEKNCSKVSANENTNGNMTNSLCKNNYISNDGDKNVHGFQKHKENFAKEILPVIAWAKAALTNMLSENCDPSGECSTGSSPTEETK
ncbi:uncharacterized protein LOC117343153 [Pecten maximus]|uniref:uncharacterized protein LOC117343153 n=1 Tax=Pecten maximus TaxID=6579 RepID=UPI001457F5B8|nr:uncharacterized protein LOC117343153 [Pecten maximus]